jgi:hypothetical protein
MNLDSLMDILACSVGVMLVVVVLGLMQARSTNVTFFMPLAQKPPADADRVMVICKDGRARPMDLGPALDVLLAKYATFDNIPGLVRRANDRSVNDGFFNYRFELREWQEGWQLRRRAVDIVVEERPGATGFDVEALKADPAAFVAALRGREDRDIWVAFSVDENSLEVFREARAVLAAHEIATGWDPGFIAFPYKETVLGGDPKAAGPVSSSFSTTQ